MQHLGNRTTKKTTQSGRARPNQGQHLHHCQRQHQNRHLLPRSMRLGATTRLSALGYGTEPNWDCEYYRDNQEAMKTERHPSPWYYWQIRCDDVPYEQYVRNHCAGAAKASEIPVPTHYTHWDRLCNNTNPGIDTAKIPLPEPVHSGHRQEMIACSIYYDYRDQMPEKMPDSNLMLWSYNKCYEVDEGSDTPQAYWCREWKANMYWANVTPRQLP